MAQLFSWLGATADKIGEGINTVTGLDPVTGTMVIGFGIGVGLLLIRGRFNTFVDELIDNFDLPLLVFVPLVVLLDYFHWKIGEPTYAARLSWFVANLLLIGTAAGFAQKRLQPLVKKVFY